MRVVRRSRIAALRNSGYLLRLRRIPVSVHLFANIMTDKREKLLRFIGQNDIEVEEFPWGPHDWMSRPGLTEATHLLLVRVHMPPGKAHQFHRHPEMEEIIYVISGKAEQWVEQELQILRPGEMAHIPKDVVHGTYNPFDEPLVFLAILSPAHFEGPALVDVFEEAPWASLKTPMYFD